MSAERIVALIIGLCAIGFGFMLMPWANALRRRMIKANKPEPVFRVFTDTRLSVRWRNHIVPWGFILLGAVLLAVGLSS